MHCDSLHERQDNGAGVSGKLNTAAVIISLLICGPSLLHRVECVAGKRGNRRGAAEVHLVLGHAKDVKPAPEGTELPASGKGVLDYPLFLRLLAQLDHPLDLILEHLTLDDVPRARDFVLEQFDKI